VRDGLLARFPSYSARASAFADPPFETRVASALLSPPLPKTRRTARPSWLERLKRRAARAEKKP
jgi:hypothetical protein